MTVSMVERVARAIATIAAGDDENWANWTDEARAAISEVWESITPEMIEGMEEMYMPMGEMRAAWDGAFLAALNEQVS